jgi:hypothetical protein
MRLMKYAQVKGNQDLAIRSEVALAALLGQSSVDLTDVGHEHGRERTKTGAGSKDGPIVRTIVGVGAKAHAARMRKSP